ncbi:MAG: ATP-binding protein [Pseudomonadota bacterium]
MPEAPSTPTRQTSVNASTHDTQAAPAGENRRAYRLLWNTIGGPMVVLAILLFGILLVAWLAHRFPDHEGRLFWTQLLLVSLSVAVLGMALRRAARKLGTPLAHLRTWAHDMRQGTFSARMPERGSDEVADLARDINRFAEWLHAMTITMDAQVRSQTERLARKTRSLDVLHDVAQSLNQPGGLARQMEGLMDTFVELFDARAAVVSLLADEVSAPLKVIRGRDSDFVNTRLMEVRCAHCGWEATTGLLHIQHGPELTCAKESPTLTIDDRYRELIVIPVRYQENTMGVYGLLLDRPVYALGEDAVDLLISIGRHLGLAVEKAWLDLDARRLAIMEERQMMGNELHDSLAQALVGMRLQIKMLGESLHRQDMRAAQNETRDLRNAMEAAHASLRELLANYRLKMDDRGLVQAIKDLVERFRQETGISVYFHNALAAPNLTPAQEIQVFHIVQEALTNIRKHSHALNVRILLDQNGHGQYSVLIEDDGEGMAEPGEGLPGEHIGLSIMRERAERLTGELTIESEAGEGTRVQLVFPVSPAGRLRAVSS